DIAIADEGANAAQQPAGLLTQGAAEPPGLSAISPRAEAEAQEQLLLAQEGPVNADILGRRVGLAQQIVDQKPENAVIALRQMLQPKVEEEPAR
ncbi:MAG TPA: hypothetical protein VN222_09640, partial [Novosphingobium sp.]|nr:hypothetical protein [Novosphingobium sp.]